MVKVLRRVNKFSISSKFLTCYNSKNFIFERRRTLAKESFDKEIQFLRMLVLTSGAFNRHQFAKRLGISVHTFDKTIKRLKEIVSSQHATEEGSTDFSDTIRYSYYDSSDPLLLFLFRAKSVKASESQRISLIIRALHERALTVLELMDICSTVFDSNFPIPDEKTIRADVKYLEEVGVIKRAAASRPYSYRIKDDLVRDLTDDELIDLYDFVDVMANTQLPSVHGYMLRDGLKKQLQRNEIGHHAIQPFLYKYHYYSRILDEAHLFTLMHAIRLRRKVSFLYFSPKSKKAIVQKTRILYLKEILMVSPFRRFH